MRRRTTLRPDHTNHDLPIEDYGLLGDTRTAALVGSNGSGDWLCIPRFDGVPVFGRLVGGPTAGSFRLAPANRCAVTARRYRRNTATMETTWRTEVGRLTLTEGMVSEVHERLLPSTMLVRRLTAQDGPVQATIEFDPRLGEAHQRPQTRNQGGITVCSWSTMAVSLTATTTETAIEPGVPHTVTVAPDRPWTCVMSMADREPLVLSSLTPLGRRYKPTSCSGRPGVRVSTRAYPNATPWSAACSRSAC